MLSQLLLGGEENKIQGYVTLFGEREGRSVAPLTGCGWRKRVDNARFFSGHYICLFYNEL